MSDKVVPIVQQGGYNCPTKLILSDNLDHLIILSELFFGFKTVLLENLFFLKFFLSTFFIGLRFSPNWPLGRFGLVVAMSVPN